MGSRLVRRHFQREGDDDVNPDTIVRASQGEDWQLKHVMLRLLAAARKDPDCYLTDGPNHWRAELQLRDFTIPVYGKEERRIIETILNCDCPSPHECGMLVVRTCTLNMDAP
jgi:hypothetical protein